MITTFKQKNHWFFALFAGLMLTACSHWHCDICPPPSDDCADVIIDKEGFLNGPDDPYQLTQVMIQQDYLETQVTFGGGCGTVFFRLYTDGELVETAPPTLKLRLSLEDRDLCEALRRESYCFDLSEFRKYQAREIRLILEGYEDPLYYRW